MNILKKWKPIIENIYQFDKVMQLAAEYLEHHSMIENKNIMYILDEAQSQPLLPVSIMAFSKINILNIDIEFIEEDFDTIYFDIPIDSNDMISKELVKKYEKILIYKLTSYINEQILEYDVLKIHTLVSTISVIAEKEFGSKMILNSNIKFLKNE